MKDRKRRFEAGISWAINHPKEFLAQMGKDTIAYDKWAKGDYAGAIASNVVGLAGLFLSFGGAGKALSALSKAKEAEGTAIKVAGAKKATADALAAAGVGAGGVTSKHAAYLQVKAAGEADLAHQRIETARIATEAAAKKAAAAAAALAAKANAKVEGTIDSHLNKDPSARPKPAT